MWPEPRCPTRFSAAPGLPADYRPQDGRTDPSAESSDNAESGRATGGGPVVAVAVRAEPQSTESPCATRPPRVGPDAGPGLPERPAADPSRVAVPAGHRCNVGTTCVGCPARSTAQRTGNTPESRPQPIATPSVIPARRRPPQPAGGESGTQCRMNRDSLPAISGLSTISTGLSTPRLIASWPLNRAYPDRCA
jgi:hypothetical protein